MGLQRPRKQAGRVIEFSDEDLEVDEIETDPPTNAMSSSALQMLARWLLSVSRKGTPVADSAPVEGSQNRLDVALAAKVGSDSR